MASSAPRLAARRGQRAGTPAASSVVDPRVPGVAVGVDEDVGQRVGQLVRALGEVADVAAMSSGRRRLRSSQRVARSISLRASSSISICVAAATWLFERLDLAPEADGIPNTSRATA